MSEIEILKQEVTRLREKTELLENVIADWSYSDRYIFQKHIQMLNAMDISFGTDKGTRIAPTTAQKMSFWGKTPIIQPASGSQGAIALTANVTGGDTVSLTNVNNNFSSIQTLLNQLRSDLVSVGIIKGEA